MPVETRRITAKTRGYSDMVDLTDGVRDAVSECEMQSGTVTVFAPGATAAISTIEYEPGLKRDIADYLEKFAPYGAEYKHHETWHDDNGASHVRATLMGPSLTVPFVNKELTLGTWQQIVLICFDTRPRNRDLVLQIMGE
ncbi:MAG: secondary thiamine-phosphate synthase enzyme YjbQ [Candidatus Sumerlaeia bacterium]